jgi:energy-coupling factor transport system permease protein
MTVLFLLKSCLFLLIFLVFICFFYSISKLHLSLAFKNIRPFFWLLGLTLFLHAFYTDGKILFQIPKIHLRVTEEGLFQGFFYALRIADLMVLAAWFTLITSPMAFADSIEKFMSPLKRIGVPAHEIAMMMSISLRFIPILLEETARIQNAQISRGASIKGNPVHKIRNVVPVLVPLFVSSFYRANELALAMDARCYRGGQSRSSYLVLKMNWMDRGIMGLMIISGLVFVLLEHQYR